MIEIPKYVPVQRGCVVAEIDVTIIAWNLTIRKIQECVKGEHRWFNMPSFCEEEYGKKNWKPYVSFDLEPSNKKLCDAIRDKIDEMLKNNPDLLPKAVEFSAEEMPF